MVEVRRAGLVFKSRSWDPASAPQKRQRDLNGNKTDFWDPKAHLRVTYLLQQDQTSKSFPNSSINWAPSIQIYKTIGAILIQIIILAMYKTEMVTLTVNMFMNWGMVTGNGRGYSTAGTTPFVLMEILWWLYFEFSNRHRKILFLLIYFILYVWVFYLHVLVCTTYMPDAQERLEDRTSYEPLHGNQTWILWKIKKYSKLQSHLPSSS